jgi:ankyrin repeat protein/trypsin-like peptidase
MSRTIIALFLFSTAGFAQRENTFLITAYDCKLGPQSRTLTGFRVLNPTPDLQVGIVSALHGVAGCKVKVTSDGNVLLRDTVQLVAVDVFSDSVLLTSQELRTKPLAGFRYQTKIDWVGMAGRQVTAWGHPSGITLKDTRLIVRNPAKERLDTFLAALGQAQRRVFDARKSPSGRLDVVSVDGIILPGDSGGPVIDGAGRVVAIANGGLFGGFGGINWAVPIDAVEWSSSENNRDFADLLNNNPAELFTFEAGKTISIVRDLTEEAREAASSGNVRFFQDLLSQGTLSTSLKRTGLQEAIESGKVTVAQFLLDNGTDIPQNALTLAVDYGHTAMVNLLLRYPVHIEPELVGEATIAATARGTDISILQTVARLKHLSPNTPAVADDAPPLHAAAEAQNLDVIQILLSIPGLNVNATNSHNETALDLACTDHNADIIRLLAKHGAQTRKLYHDTCVQEATGKKRR